MWGANRLTPKDMQLKTEQKSDTIICSKNVSSYNQKNAELQHQNSIEAIIRRSVEIMIWYHS